MSSETATNDVALLPLNEIEATKLRNCEDAIERGRKSFIEVGNALAEIQEHKLYRATHKTFDAYLKERWDIGRAYASRLIGSAKTMPALLPIGNNLPANESQLRPLLQFPEGHRAEVWQDILKRSCGTAPTAREIERIVNDLVSRGDTPVYKARRRAIRADGQRRDEVLYSRRMKRDSTRRQKGNEAAENHRGEDECIRGGQHEPGPDGECVKCYEPGVGPVTEIIDVAATAPDQETDLDIDQGDSQPEPEANPYFDEAVEVEEPKVEESRIANRKAAEKANEAFGKLVREFDVLKLTEQYRPHLYAIQEAINKAMRGQG